MGFYSRYLVLCSMMCAVAAGTYAGGSSKSVLDTAQALPVDIAADASRLLVTDGAGQGLHLVDTVSGAAQVVSSGATAGYGAKISAGSGLVAFKSIAADGAQSPAIFDPASAKTKLLATSALAGTPAISASGAVAFTVENQLIVQASDGSETGRFDLGHHVNLVAITSDGGAVAYNDEEDQIIVLSVKSGKRVKVSDDKASYFNPVFSPNGKKVVMQTIAGNVVVSGSNKAKTRTLGAGDNPQWLDNSTVCFTSKTVNEGVQVTKSDVVAVSTSGKVKGVLATSNGDAAAVAKGNAIAVAASPVAGATRAAAPTLQVGLTSKGTAWLSPLAVTLAKTDAPKERAVVDTTAMQYLSNVPYIHQNNDTPDWWNGNSSCNAAAALMALQYYNTLPAHPMTATWPTPHNSDYGWYIPNQYTFNGHTYSQVSYDQNGTLGRGSFGYITQNGWEDTKTHMAEFISYHGPSSAVDWSPTMAKARSEIAANHPFVILTSITSAGHYPLCIGYVKNQNTLIFNDPYGNKNTGSYPSDNGRMARYDWPGYNNGYSNMNTVHCYIWCRSGAAPPADIIVDNSSANFTASTNWSTGTSAADKYGTNYRFRSTAAVSDAAVWSFNIAQARNYEIYALWSQGTNRSATAPFILPDNTSVSKNQQTGGGAWQSLGIKNLSTGTKQVKLSCWTTAGFVVVADAIKVVAR